MLLDALEDNCGTSLDRKVGGVTSLGGKTEGGMTSLKEGVISEQEKGEMSLDALEDNCGTLLDREIGGVTSSNNDCVTSLGEKTEGNVTSLDKKEGDVTSSNNDGVTS
ncbi:hypothetical protein LSTR_LSTR014308 [Laodelphax striatellus]|uniref:Uncharacterized protein n=1 Tax=Laodelphax striatellus TaxID=195883 RepID=A0A482X002_LAOST|nr:hypothetical protein LSTR_LSTR014308 [Laodelphax striatellus]